MGKNQAVRHFNRQKIYAWPCVGIVGGKEVRKISKTAMRPARSKRRKATAPRNWPAFHLRCASTKIRIGQTTACESGMRNKRWCRAIQRAGRAISEIYRVNPG